MVLAILFLDLFSCQSTTYFKSLLLTFSPIKDNLDKGSYTICSGCRNPINKKDEGSKYYEKGVSCKDCYDKTSDSKKMGLREREKQKQIAIERNNINLFVDISADDYLGSGI